MDEGEGMMGKIPESVLLELGGQEETLEKRLTDWPAHM